MSASVNLVVDAEPLDLATLRAVWGAPVNVSLGARAKHGVAASNAAIADVVEHGDTVYGVNTGFGQLASVRISDDELSHLQENLVRSHSVGVGEDLDDDTVRLILLMKIAALARGYSGVRVELVETLCALLNHDIYPRIPARGSVGRIGRPRTARAYGRRAARLR